MSLASALSVLPRAFLGIMQVLADENRVYFRRLKSKLRKGTKCLKNRKDIYLPEKVMPVGKCF